MKLPIASPFLPMEAKLVANMPTGEEWQYEPKWDGFRCLAFRSSDEIELQSKAGQPLTRYFPEIVEALAALAAKYFVLDGELIVPIEDRLSFNALLQRIHPAASRVARLAKETPARFVLFDFLVDAAGESLISLPLSERRKRLEKFAARYLKTSKSIELSTATRDISVAKYWLSGLRGQLDGVVCKRIDEPYISGERAMLKVKNLRSADCVVGGFRYASAKKIVGSLLLGLYDAQGKLNHVGFTSSIPLAEREKLTKKLENLIEPPGFTGAAPGGPSRWSTERSTEWQPLKPELVVEVQYDHFTGARFRHGTRLLRWRPDKDPKQCTAKQVAFESCIPLSELIEQG
ncbi:MAG TPA: ATP-dependent DNA ligase [Bryobacteraceae bacterium]|nr:ATP-dependent DNA ligase [Bryobacteraceae bacterium]